MRSCGECANNSRSSRRVNISLCFSAMISRKASHLARFFALAKRQCVIDDTSHIADRSRMKTVSRRSHRVSKLLFYVVSVLPSSSTNFANTLASTLSSLVWAYFGAKEIDAPQDPLLTAPFFALPGAGGWGGPLNLVYILTLLTASSLIQRRIMHVILSLGNYSATTRTIRRQTCIDIQISWVLKFHVRLSIAAIPCSINTAFYAQPLSIIQFTIRRYSPDQISAPDGIA